MNIATRLTMLLGIAALTTPVAAKDHIDPTAYPELSQQALLPLIVERLKRDLSDVYSIRDLVMCPPTAIKLVDGKPDAWVVELQFNTKNQVGGYTGITNYGARFKHGRISAPITIEGFTDNKGFNGVINAMIDRRFANCPAVLDATVQALLQRR